MAETIETYEPRVGEIEARRQRTTRMERFTLRIDGIEADIKPQLDELRALRVGLSRLRQAAEGNPAVESAASDGSAHGRTAKRSARLDAHEVRRRQRRQRRL